MLRSLVGLVDVYKRQRLWNAISPFTINIGTNETRAWLMRSGVNLKQTFNTGPNGEDLEGRPNLKSKFQFYMGQQNVEEKLKGVLENPEIQDSILRMEQAHRSGRHYSPGDTAHSDLIAEIFAIAKKEAWHLLMNDPGYEKEAAMLLNLHQLGQLRKIQLKRADYKGAKSTHSKIEELQNIPK